MTPGRHADCVERAVPVISVDTKKKELIGNFKNRGQEWQPQGEPDLVDVHDFPGDAVGKAIPYGVYDLAANDGFVSVGTDHDTQPCVQPTPTERDFRDPASEAVARADGELSGSARVP